jgi:hypothetical protein
MFLDFTKSCSPSLSSNLQASKTQGAFWGCEKERIKRFKQILDVFHNRDLKQSFHH